MNATYLRKCSIPKWAIAWACTMSESNQIALVGHLLAKSETKDFTVDDARKYLPKLRSDKECAWHIPGSVGWPGSANDDKYLNIHYFELSRNEKIRKILDRMQMHHRSVIMMFKEVDPDTFKVEWTQWGKNEKGEDVNFDLGKFSIRYMLKGVIPKGTVHPGQLQPSSQGKTFLCVISRNGVIQDVPENLGEDGLSPVQQCARCGGWVP
jgi:hypothetical protein